MFYYPIILFMRQCLKEQYYLIICFILGVCCLVYFFTSKHYYPYSNYSDPPSYEIYHLRSDKDTVKHSNELLAFLFEKRKDHYSTTLNTLSTSINRLALLVLLALLLLYFQPADIELFGIKIPNLAVYVVLPVCILYYWLLLGFSLFNAIASRESLFHLSAKIERSYFSHPDTRVNLLHSSKNSLEDISIIDAWSNVFLGYYEEDYSSVLRTKTALLEKAAAGNSDHSPERQAKKGRLRKINI